MKLQITSQQLVEKAMSEIETLTPDQVNQLMKADQVMLVDIRDPRELKKEGKLKGAFHCPRGLIEFWTDSESPYFKEEFATDKKIVLYCAAGWRSALTVKTLQDMGATNIAHIEGGFTEWKSAGFEVEQIPPKKHES